MKAARSNFLVNEPATTWSASRGKDDLWMASASDLDALLHRNEVSPVEITESVIKRIESLNGELNAFCHIATDSARRAARESESRAKKRSRLSRLDGLPVHVKDNLFVSGMPCTWGSRLYKDHLSEVDDLPVAKLRAAGVVLLGKTNTPEFALMGKTENALFGATRNPWNLSMTPGGSSGGAAAAVAAGMGPLALATDAGGSIRRPASYCGVVGLKTSLGKVARGIGFSATVHDFQTIGPIARDAADARMLLNAIAQCQTEDKASRLKTKRITILDVPSRLIEPDVDESLQAAASALIGLGHMVDTGPAPWELDQVESLWQFFSSVGAARLAACFETTVWACKATPQMQALALKGNPYSAVHYVERMDDLRKMRYEAEYEWFRGSEFILTPTAPTPAWPIDDPYPKKIAGQEAGARACSVFAVVVNAAGLPALSMPVGKSRMGLPIGVQLIGPPGSDLALLELGAQLEERLKNAQKQTDFV